MGDGHAVACRRPRRKNVMSTPAPSADPEGAASANPGMSPGLAGRLSRLAAPLLIAVAVQSAGNLVFHSVVGRALGPEAYGALGAVLAAMTLVAVPLTALQTASARTTAAGGLTRATARQAIVRALGYSLPLAIAIMLLAEPVRGYLHLNSWWDAAILAPTLMTAIVIAVARGLLLGAGRTGMVAWSFILATVVRLGPGLVMAYVWGVTGALVATLAGEVCALALVAWVALRAQPGVLTPVTVREVTRTGIVVAGLFAFTTIDLFLARHYLTGIESGYYVAGANIGKTVLALPAAALSVAYPKLVAAWREPGRFAQLRSALVVVGVPALAGLAVVAVLPGLVLLILYGGGEYAGAAQVTRILAIVAGTSAFVSVLAHAALARSSWWALFPWVAAALEVGLIMWRHGSPVEVAQASVAALILALVGLSLSELPVWRRDPTPGQVPDHVPAQA